MAKIRKKYITENIDERYFSITNNIDDLYTHKKINIDSNSIVEKSGILSMSKGKLIKLSNSEMGTLPSTVITTGKKLQSHNDPFEETNILLYKNIISNSTIGLPLIEIKKDDNVTNDGYYITTNESLIEEGTIKRSDEYFVEKYSLDNTKVFENPNKFSIESKSERNIVNNIDEEIFKQNRFQEKYTPYNENYSVLNIPSTDDSFYYNTVDKDIKENYKLGNQKQIKIVLDFSGQETSDLLLMNTKITFNLPNETENTSGFTDNLLSTRYFNFVNNKKSSYSSHFMPTAYWNFDSERWNYLDGAALKFDDASELNVGDFPVENINEIKYSYLGLKNTKGTSLSISPNFIFDSNSVIDSNSIQSKHLDNSFRSIYNKPILITPSFRNDESLNANKTGENYNKTPVCRVTNTYGFPYKANWQPHKNHTLDMSQYIRNSFLLEKVVIKGKFTSNGEMPVTKGNFSSGYRESGADNKLSTKQEFDEVYTMKDNHNSDYIANAVSFFILNERKGLNYFDQKVIPDSLQSYIFTKQLGNITNDSKNTKGKKLKDYLGSFSTYEKYQNTLSVYSQIIPSSYLYAIDNYNNLTLENTYVFKSNNKDVTLNLNENSFYYLDVNDDSNDTVDTIFYKNVDSWDDNFDLDVLTDSGVENIRIKVENNTSASFDANTGRELVSYSNLLICNKYSDIELDKKVLSNIDEQYIINTDRNTTPSVDLNLNIENPVSFEVKSQIKSIEDSDYTDESIYKIKSNIFETIVEKEEEESTVNIGLNISSLLFKNSNNIFPINSLFSYSNAAAANGSKITEILGQSISSLVNEGLISDVIPFTFDFGYHVLNTKIKYDSNIKDARFIVRFSYRNPSINNTSNVYSDRNSYNSEPIIYWDDFVEYDVIDVSNNKYNIIDVNLRFLDPWDDYGIYSAWLGLDKVNNEGSKITNYYLSGDTELKVSSVEKWSNASLKEKAYCLIKFIVYGLVNKNIITTDNIDTGKKLYQFLESDKSIKLIDHIPEDISSEVYAQIKLKETIFDPYLDDSDYLDNNIDLDRTELVKYANYFSILKDDGGKRGLPEASNIESFFNYNNILEGKCLGSVNNIDIISERVIDHELKSKEKSLYRTLSKSGKVLKSIGSLDTTRNISYLIKPEDRLVFGVTSNCNGETMPTVVKLHDKLEITLIGRDYIEDSNYKANQSKSIRRVITGDNHIEKSGASIYQTSGSYYDNVWSRNSLEDSLEDFKIGKEVVGKNSSRDFGTYTGVITFDRELKNNKEIYLSDSVNPSIATVFFDCFNKTPLFTIDSKDRYNKRRSPGSVLPSYKILLSESVSEANKNKDRYKNIVTDWHKKYHLEEYKTFFNSYNNKKVSDYSYDKFENILGDARINKKYFIYYDINSYSAGLNYEDVKSQEMKSKVNNDENATSEEDTYKYYKTLKTYLLPFSKNTLIQNALETKNNSLLEIDGSLSIDNFLHNDTEIELDFNKANIFTASNYSIQYLKNDLVPEYCSYTEDVKSDIVGKDNNDIAAGWCIVIEASDYQVESLINSLDVATKNTFMHQDNITVKENSPITIEYYHKHLNITISESVASIPNDINKQTSATKNFKLITKTTSSEKLNFLVAPLYFWETNEIKWADNSVSLSNIGYGRHFYNNNPANSSGTPDLAWYASLSSDHDTKIVDYDYWKTNNVFRDITGHVLDSPYSIDNLTSANASAFIKGKILFSLCKHKIKSLEASSPVYLNKGNNINLIGNFYNVNKNKLYFSSEAFLDNNIVLRDKQALATPDESDKHIYLNEKIYKSSCKVVNNTSIENTTIDFLYKVKNQYITLESDNTQDPYNVIELMGIVNNFTLFEKDSVQEDTLVYNLSSTDKIRFYEESLLNNSKFYSLDANVISSLPYFEIDLNSKFQIGSPAVLSNQIPYSHYKLDYISGDADIEIASVDSNSLYDVNTANVNTGSPIYELEKTPIGYRSKDVQESKMKDFFYGFSRRKHRYPIERLDGYKYGVVSGSKKSFKHHYSSKRFGNFADKIMGSSNFASSYLDNEGITRFTWAVEKLFVDQYFQYITSSNVQNAYNKDDYARSSYPYIEDATHELSLLNVNNTNYVAEYVEGRF